MKPGGPHTCRKGVKSTVKEGQIQNLRKEACPSQKYRRANEPFDEARERDVNQAEQSG